MILEYDGVGEESQMAAQPQTRVATSRPPRTRRNSIARAENDLLARVMVSVSASLESMSEEQGEQAVVAAENAVAHLQ